VLSVHRAIVGLPICLWLANVIEAQAPVPDRLNAKALEAAVTYAQSLAQWQFAIIGASLLLIVGNSHLALPSRRARLLYFLFVPAWGFSGLSIYFGTRVQQVYLAYLLVPKTTLEGATLFINDESAKEILYMFVGLSFLVVWVIIYVSWWVFRKDALPGATTTQMLVTTTTTSFATPTAAPVAPPPAVVVGTPIPTPGSAPKVGGPP
jgi:hypothetical protein